MELKETIEFKELGYHIINCPVCNHETLDNFWICTNCFWEYDGITDENKYSSANGSTIKQWKKNDKKRGFVI